MRTFTCKVAGCGYSIEATGPGVLNKHRREAHPELKRPYKRRTAANGTPAAHGGKRNAGVDAETQLLSACSALFEGAELDRGGDQRVLEYLAARWGPAAYEGTEEDPAPLVPQQTD